jgi:uncharacterized membrane protein YfcA
MSDTITAYIRTWCALAVGSLATWLLRTFAIEIDTTAAVALITPIITGLLYALIHWAEVHIDRRIGWLLGIAKRPTYAGSGLK